MIRKSDNPPEIHAVFYIIYRLHLRLYQIFGDIHSREQGLLIIILIEKEKVEFKYKRRERETGHRI
jgi:hypothetical protein